MKLIGVSESNIRNFAVKGQLKSPCRTPGEVIEGLSSTLYIRFVASYQRKTFERPSARLVLAVMTKKNIWKGRNPYSQIIVKKKHPDMK